MTDRRARLISSRPEGVGTRALNSDERSVIGTYSPRVGRSVVPPLHRHPACRGGAVCGAWGSDPREVRRPGMASRIGMRRNW